MKLNGWDQYYPRPQLRRSSYFPLNRVWTLNGRPIQIPWPPQAPLSLWEGVVGNVLQYKTSFTLPTGFLSENRRALLHLGAVDQVAEVFVNGERVVRHEGGYLPFSADITDVLRPEENTLEVTAVDTLSHDYPYDRAVRKVSADTMLEIAERVREVCYDHISDHRLEKL